MPDTLAQQILVRRAERRDVPCCADIFLEGRRDICPGHGANLFRWDDYLDCVAGEEVWVAEYQNRVVGFASICRTERTLKNLFVNAAWRSRGVGEQLMDGVLSQVRGVIFLRCAARNVRARAFYERTGWDLLPQGSSSEGEFVLFRRSADPLPL